jgi:hypothetical protein
MARSIFIVVVLGALAAVVAAELGTHDTIAMQFKGSCTMPTSSKLS